MITVKRCRAAEIFDDPASERLIAEYAEECALALIGTPQPRRERYEGLEASGFAQCFAVREDGQLVGFAMVLIAVVPHYELSLATTESLFVAREAHGGGRELMKVTEDYARACGAATIIHTAPVGSRFARLLFLCADQYTNTNHVFARRLA